MERAWIDEGLRHEREREAQQLRRSENRHLATSVIKTQGPALMRRLVAEVGAVVDEYRRKAQIGGHDLEFATLPHEGFCLSKTRMPRVGLECRPDYDAHILSCNLTRTDDQESDPTEWMFNLDLALDAAGNITLHSGTRAFEGVDDAVQYMVRPVLFPLLDEAPYKTAGN